MKNSRIFTTVGSETAYAITEYLFLPLRDNVPSVKRACGSFRQTAMFFPNREHALDPYVLPILDLKFRQADSSGTDSHLDPASVHSGPLVLGVPSSSNFTHEPHPTSLPDHSLLLFRTRSEGSGPFSFLEMHR